MYKEKFPDLPCFFDANAKAHSDLLWLTEEEAHHASKVLRLGNGQAILVSNGQGGLFLAEITEIKKNQIAYKSFQNLDSASADFQPLKKTSLAIGVMRDSSRMEWLVEKATEVGLTNIYFYEAEKSQTKFLRLNRLEKACISALKQSRKSIKPQIKHIGFEELLTISCQNKWVATAIHGIENHLKFKLNSLENLVVIGPEGDFSVNELKKLEDNGFIACNLGNERLRSETAALYALIICTLP